MHFPSTVSNKNHALPLHCVNKEKLSNKNHALPFHCEIKDKLNHPSSSSNTPGGALNFSGPEEAPMQIFLGEPRGFEELLGGVGGA